MSWMCCTVVYAALAASAALTELLGGHRLRQMHTGRPGTCSTCSTHSSHHVQQFAVQRTQHA